jgi:hypothetical protein
MYMEDKMMLILSVIIQIIMWCGYSWVLYLSHHDHSLYETVLLVMFAYFNYLVAQRFIPDKSKAVYVTVLMTLIFVMVKVSY